MISFQSQSGCLELTQASLVCFFFFIKNAKLVNGSLFLSLKDFLQHFYNILELQFTTQKLSNSFALFYNLRLENAITLLGTYFFHKINVHFLLDVKKNSKSKTAILEVIL